MTHQHDRKAKAVFDNLKNANRKMNDSPVTLLARVALSVIYMYLILISYELLGIAGPVFISSVFLVAFFIPYFYHRFAGRVHKRKEGQKQATVVEEARQEG